MELYIEKDLHKHVIGPKGRNVATIMRKYTISVEVPPMDHESEYIILRGDGDKDKLGAAASMVFRMANGQSVISEDITVEQKYHGHIIGPAGAHGQLSFTTLSFISLLFHTKGISFVLLLFAVNRIKNETGVHISIPSAPENTIRLEGKIDGVAWAKQEILGMVRKLEREEKDGELRSFKLEVSVDPKYYPRIIGRQGTVISMIRNSHKVTIQFPERGSKSENIITITGNKEATKAAEADIMKIVREQVNSFYISSLLLLLIRIKEFE